MLAEPIFHIGEHEMTVIACDVGGSFGMKGGLYPEVVVAAWAARKVGRPVKWVCERSEAFISDEQARDIIVHKRELGFDDGGQLSRGTCRLRSQYRRASYPWQDLASMLPWHGCRGALRNL